jgi:alkanesulfonate monooxygenase SsuD/methylene tetrahydromethanopterin reductase-like flavin-dependent oxidoreductase (luciferase family)
MRLGLLVMDEDPVTAVAVARQAEAAGFDSVWSIDYYNRHSLTRAAMFAASTDALRIGTSITPAFSASALAVASAAADVQRFAGGRFTLGLGTSTRRMNQDWYGAVLEHPAPRFAERIDLVRRLLAHPGGPFAFEGRFDRVALAHFDREVAVPPVRIFGAAVSPIMTKYVGTCADGFVGHPIASAGYLASCARPRLDEGAAAAGRSGDDVTVVSQIIVAIDDDRAAARRRAALQVGFYSTVKGYDALFADLPEPPDRTAIREAFRARDLDGLVRATGPLVEDRAVFGTLDDVEAQLKRYEDVVDLALFYSPHYGLSEAEVRENESAILRLTGRSA